MNVNYDVNGLYKITPDDVKEAITVAGDAFLDDPVIVYTYPDEKERKEKSKYGFYALYNYGIKYGLTYATSKNLEGITIWLPPNKVYHSTLAMMRYGGFYTMRKTGLKAGKRVLPLFKYQEERHKELVPYDHWYFQQISVKPEEQRKGFGGLLIRTMLKTIERDGLPIYVDTNTEKAMLIYQKYGFEILEHTLIPETDILLWCMLRKPNGIKR